MTTTGSACYLAQVGTFLAPASVDSASGEGVAELVGVGFDAGSACYTTHDQADLVAVEGSAVTRVTPDRGAVLEAD